MKGAPAFILLHANGVPFLQQVAEIESVWKDEDGESAVIITDLGENKTEVDEKFWDIATALQGMDIPVALMANDNKDKERERG